MARVEPLGQAIFDLPAAAVREDAAVALTLGVRYGLPFARVGALGGAALQRPFAELLDAEGITDVFIRRWLDMICFLLQGATTREAPTTLMAYMLSDFYKPGVCLDYPRGGTSAIVGALARGLTKHDGCALELNARVAELVVDGGRTRGVRLADGRTLRATRAVVSNADMWSTRRLVPAAAAAPGGDAAPLVAYLDAQCARVERCASFLHLHVGIDAAGLPTSPSEAFPAQWAALDDWERGVDAPRNLVLVSCASLLDPSLAPDGCHVLHAYVPATEPYEEWARFERAGAAAPAGDAGAAYDDDAYRRSAEYRAAKDAAADVLWRAIERYIPDARARAKISRVGSPLTHARYLRRDRGTYGALVDAATGELLPGHKTPLPGLFMCGDSTFPGIGVPAVAASALITANSIVSVPQHWRMLDAIKM